MERKNKISDSLDDLGANFIKNKFMCRSIKTLLKSIIKNCESVIIFKNTQTD